MIKANSLINANDNKFIVKRDLTIWETSLNDVKSLYSLYSIEEESIISNFEEIIINAKHFVMKVHQIKNCQKDEGKPWTLEAIAELITNGTTLNKE